MKQYRFSILKRFKSFVYAFSGLKILFKEEHNSRVQLFVALCVLIAGFVFSISAYEWIALIFCIGFVLALETINSVLENISDFVSPQNNETIKKVKDLSAAAVLLGAITTLIIGLIIFVPKIFQLVKA